VVWLVRTVSPECTTPDALMPATARNIEWVLYRVGIVTSDAVTCKVTKLLLEGRLQASTALLVSR
jgi:hypothetical protein